MRCNNGTANCGGHALSRAPEGRTDSQSAEPLPTSGPAPFRQQDYGRRAAQRRSDSRATAQRRSDSRATGDERSRSNGVGRPVLGAEQLGRACEGGGMGVRGEPVASMGTPSHGTRQPLNGPC
jgi:hypothetical protein